MGIIFDFSTGKKITPQQASAKPPIFGRYGFQRHAKKTKITGGKVGFHNKITNVAWDKTVRQSGKNVFTTKDGKKMTAKQVKQEVGELVGQAGSKGISGQLLKKKLVRKLGMKYKDADIITRAATYHFYKPEGMGTSKEDIKRRIVGSRISDEQAKPSMAEKLVEGREDRAEKVLRDEKNKKWGMEGIGVEKDGHMVYMGQASPKAGHEPAVSVEQGQAPAPVTGEHGNEAEVGEPEAEPLAGGFGTKQQDKKEGAETAKKEAGSKVIHLAEDQTGLAGPRANKSPQEREGEIIESPGQKQAPTSLKSEFMEDLRKKYNKIIEQKRKAADDYEEAPWKTGTDG